MEAHDNSRRYEISPIGTAGEGRETTTVARRVFGPGAALLLPAAPEWGFAVHDSAAGDDTCVGGVIIEKLAPAEGLLSWIFVDPRAQGHRLGSRLLESGIGAMDEAGLATQFSLVRADNTASWNMFAKRHYTRPSVLTSLFGYSPRSFLARLSYSCATGYSTWVRDHTRTRAPVHPTRLPILKSLLFSVFVGAAISLFSLRGTEFFFIALAMVTGITVLRMAVAYPIARLSGPVRFDAPQGGTPLSVILALAFGTWWPTFGFFVPKAEIWHEPDFRRHNGLQAFATWMSLLAVYAAASLLYTFAFQAGLKVFLALAIVYQTVPVFPFDGMDGAKVLRFSRLLYVLAAAASIATLIVFW